MLKAAGHDVVGFDTDYFAQSVLGPPSAVLPHRHADLRDVTATDLEGFEAVVHLGALSNDPLGDLDPRLTDEINHLASVRLARCAKQAGVERFLFSSSCSSYGTAGDDLVGEETPQRPVAPYGESKVAVERDVSLLADERFSPTFLRNATAYGASPRLRLDLVVNELVALALTTGEILVKSDGTPWRPLIHVEDIARAFVTLLSVPRERVHNQALNVGRSSENYRVRELAEIVREVVPGSTIRYAEGAGPDKRCYRVDFGKIARLVPEFQPQWDVRRGACQLLEAYRAAGLTEAQVIGPRYRRLGVLRELMTGGRIDSELRWVGNGKTQRLVPV
jgi:nucleoside-diphosphate-sugar epimerase